MATTKPTPTEDGKSKTIDPLDLHGRLYNQVGALLDQLEKRDDDEEGIKITLKERIAALIAVGRIMTIFSTLRRREPDDPNAGAAARKYQGVFKDEAGRGAKGRRRRDTSGPAQSGQPDPWFERNGVTDDGDGSDDAEFDA